MKTTSFLKLVPLLLVLVFLAGCGKKDETKASQVAARVNADEITIYQINNAVSRAKNLSPEDAVKAKSAILEKLIDRQLAKQQAISTKLDRNPSVVQAIEAAREEILARAYLEKVTSALPKPTPDEVKKYYDQHPELFAQRRVYNLEELVVSSKEGLDVKLGEQVAKAKSLEQVAAWLKLQDVEYSANRGVRAAEALPLNVVPKLHTLKDGEIRLIEIPGGRASLNVFHLVSSRTVPVDEATATPRIQQFLFNQKASNAISTEMKSLRDKADIAYLGEFVGGAEAADARAKAEAEAQAKEAAKAKAEAEAQAKAGEEAKAKAQAESQARAEAIAKAREQAEAARREADAKAKSAPSKPVELRQEDIEKGLRGLK